jgi:outer membrane protein OmpU
MKKVLFATTALVAFAGAASAQSTSVALSGSAEMGIVGGTGVDTQFFQSVDVRFSLRGTSDNGLSFGATVDLEDAAEQANNVDVTGFADYTVFISGDWGTLTMGDTDGAMDWALTEAGNMANPGSIADDETSHAGYQGSYLDGTAGGAAGDGQILRYDNTFGAVGVAVSVEQSGNGANDTGFAVGLRYALDLGGTTVNLGAGHQEGAGNGDISATGISAVAGFGPVTAGIVYTSFDNADASRGDHHVGVGLGYEAGPIALHVNYGEWDGTRGDGFGIAAAYDLGGGAGVHVAYGDQETWSLGVAMSF